MDESYVRLVWVLFGCDRDVNVSHVLTDDHQRLLEVEISKLSNRKADVIHRRFGIGEPRQTLKHIGAVYGVSIESVRQHEVKALCLLRRSLCLYPIQATLAQAGMFMDPPFDPRKDPAHLETLKKKIVEDGVPTNDELKGIHIVCLGLSVRTENCLKWDLIETLLDLTQKRERHLLQIPFFGRKSLNEIEEALARFGLSL